MYPEILTPDTSQYTDNLEILALKEIWLQEIGVKALAAYNQTTTHDAKNAAGSYAYFAAVRAKREVLCPQGWEPDVRGNIEMTVNPKTQDTIIVSSGNKDTGLQYGFPKTKNPKGTQTKLITEFNWRQTTLPHPSFEQKVQNIAISKIWILLFHFDMSKSEVRLELSLPVEMDVDNMRVIGWSKRIILPSIDFTHQPTPQKSPKDILPEFKVELKRKSNV